MKNRILSNITISKRARLINAGPMRPGGFWWSEYRCAPGRVHPAGEFIRINHTGWFLDSNQDEKAHGIVIRLPSNGGFLAGYAIPDRGINEVSLQVWFAPEDAAHDADEQARIYADKEYEHNEAWHEGDILRGVIEEKTRDVLELFDARHHPRVRRDIKEHIADIRAFQAEFKALCGRYDLSY